jgi:GT2 family glycosyltransferase
MSKENKKSILIAVPCFGANIDSHTAGAIYASGIVLQEKGIKTGLYFVNNESFIPSARNQIAYEFLASDFTHLMSIDADIGFQPQDILALLEMDKEFCAATYNAKTKESRPTVVYSPTTHEPEYIGMGFVLLKKSVFEKIAPITEKLISPNSWGNVEYYNFFGPIIKDKAILTDDFAFCERWKKVNGKIYLNEKIKLIHYGKYGY